MNVLLIFLGKLFSLISKTLNLGHGSTWPGHIALSLNKNFIKDIFKNSKTKIILIAGTNGKTTTSLMIKKILEENGNSVFQNESGANLLNGIASSILSYSTLSGNLNYDYAIFEVDENSLPLILQELTPYCLLLLNLFRDQLDRYGEVNSIAKKWSSSIQQLNNLPAGRQVRTILILNADDPQIAYLGNTRKENTFYFGLTDKKLGQTTYQHASDSTYCPKCGTKLTYSTVYYSHVGEWSCQKCKLTRPKLNLSDSPIFPLPGIYNKYNTIAAVLVAQLNTVSNLTIKQSLTTFKPAFGRQELIELNNKKVQIFLSKNPTSFNESLRTITELNAKHILFVLNDRIPDGRDVSWIWDVDFEEYVDKFQTITVTGDRCFDMGLRIKYSNPQLPITNYQLRINPNLKNAIKAAFKKISESETLYILPTYSAMLKVRKILTGKKIL